MYMQLKFNNKTHVTCIFPWLANWVLVQYTASRPAFMISYTLQNC